MAMNVVSRIAQIGFGMSVLIGVAGCFSTGGDSTDTSQPISVNAGVDVQVNERANFTLTAVADPSGGSYLWQQIAGPVVLSDSKTGASISLTAPSVKLASNLQFRVTYTTTDNRTTSDTVNVTVNSVNQLPLAKIAKLQPSGNLINVLDSVVLSAASSSDPDDDGAIVSYQWRQVLGPTQLLGNAVTTASELAFTGPLLSSAAIYRFAVVVTDDEGGQSEATYDISVTKSTKQVIAVAPSSTTLPEFSQWAWDGSNSLTATGSLQCQWQQLSGPAVDLTAAQSCTTSVSLPDVDQSQTASFRLTASNGSSSDSSDFSVTITPRLFGKLNDSGQVDCFDDALKQNCGSASFPGQDAEFGRDRYRDVIDKVGQGRSGFDFTKLDSNGDELPDDASSFACVRDNVTGLIWEVKTATTGTLPNTSLRAGHNRYSWYNTDVDNGGVDGSQAAALTTCPSTTNCSSAQYITEVNALNYCGGINWRMPTFTELHSLLDYGQQGQATLLDTHFFPNQPPSSLTGDLHYWVQETSADGTNFSAVWVLDVGSGNDTAILKSETVYLRLVRTP